MMHCLILTGGTIDIKFASTYCSNITWDYCIAADHGASAARALQIIPDCLIGDFDSVISEDLDYFRRKGIEVIEFPPEKDYTDTHLAIETAIQKGAELITILGATGTRLDHVLANIGLLHLGLKQNVTIQLVDTNNRIRMTKSELIIRKSEQFGSQISLLAFGGEAAGIDLAGFYYPLQNGTLSCDVSVGISNVLVEEEGRISVKQGTLLVIESKD